MKSTAFLGSAIDRFSNFVCIHKIFKLKKPLVDIPILAGLCLAPFLVIPGKASSQELIFGLKGGINRSRIGQNFINDAPASDGTMIRYQSFTRTGWSLGATAEYSPGRWKYQSALSLVVKGNKDNIRSLDPNVRTDDNVNSELRVNYLQIPLTASYKFRLSNLVLFVGGGPYLALGLSGKHLHQGSFGGYNQDDHHSVEFGSGYGENGSKLKRTDMGMNYQIGADLLKNASLSATFEQSLSNKYRIFGFNLGYRLFTVKKAGKVQTND